MAEESKWAALVEADGAEETKVIPTDDVETTPPDQGAEVSKWANLDPKGEYSTTDITYDDRVNLNVDDYRDELGGDIYLPDGENGIDILNKDRATNQAWYNQAGNFLGQAVVGEIVGGTLEGLGYMLDIGSIIDVMQGDEADWGNFITEAGQGIREGTQEALQIHQDPTAQGWDKMADSGWWFSNSVSIASTLSMLIPTMGAMKAASFIGKGLGASKGMKAVRRAAGMAEEMGSKSKWMTNGLSQAVLSRNIENWMEAHGTYEDHKNTKLNEIDPATGENFTEEKAGKLAGEAASGNWKKGWAMLLQDIPQFLAIGKIFDPISKKMVNSLGAASKKGIMSKLKPWQQKVGAIGGTFVGEGAEESYQYLIAEQSKYKSDLDAGYISQEDYDKKMSDAYGSEEMLTSAFFGGLGGNLFQAAGSGLNEAFKSKDAKEYEEKLGAMYTENINSKAKQVALMFQHLNAADQQGSAAVRETILNESMLNLTADALESGKFDQFYETIGLVSEMSEEDLKAFEETTGQEFSTELAKDYAPKIQKKAVQMRDKYLKYRKTHSALTSSRLSRLELENDSITDIVNGKLKESRTIKGEIGEDFDRNATDRLRKRLDIRERGQVLKKRNLSLKSRLKREKSEIKKAFIQEAIDNNDRLLVVQKADAQQQKVDTKNRTASEKEVDGQRIENDKAAEKIYNKLYKDQILTALDIAAQGREQIIINKEDMAFAKTSEGAKLQQAERLRKQIASYDQVEDKAEAISALKEAKESLIPNADYITSVEKEEAIKGIDAKILEYENQIGEAKATKLAEETETRLKEKNKKENADPTIESNQIIKDVGDIIEDENFEANPDTTYAQIDSADKVAKATAGDGKLLALLDRVEGTEAYQKWNENPTSKVGKEFGYTVSERSEKIGKEQNDAIEAFEKLPKGGKVPQSIYDHLPIRATLKDHAAIMTYLPHKPSDDTSLEDKVAYEKGYAAQRVVIIDMLRKGETVTATVALNTGGELNVRDNNEDGVVPENSVMDLLQIGNMVSKVKLLITDKFGYLLDTNKENDKELGHRPILLQNDNKGNKMPYRGGMFLKVKKANGEPFALRLNLLKNTREQSQILAGLLIRLGVPTAQRDEKGVVLKNEKGTQIVKKEIVLGSTVSELDEDVRKDIERLMGPELKMLDPEYQNPKIVDLINAFVYVSKETENKTTALYFSDKNHLIFGDKGDAVTLINREDNDVHDNLVEFLMNKKRRQFSINLWNKSDEYKEYVLDNKIVNTDASTNEALFTNQRKRWAGIMKGGRIQLYMNPVGAKAQAGVIKDSKGNETLSNQSEKEQLDAPHSTAFGSERFGGKKAESPVTTPAKAEVAPSKQSSEVEEITKEFTKGNVTARITNKPKYIYEKEAIENAKGELIELELVKSGRMEQGFSQLIDTSTGETIATSWRGSGKIFQSGKSTEEILEFILGDSTVADILGTSDLPSLLQQPTQQNVQTAFDILDENGVDFNVNSLEIVVKRESEKGISEQIVAAALISASDEKHGLGSILHTVKVFESRNLSRATLGEKERLKKYDKALAEELSKLGKTPKKPMSKMLAKVYEELKDSPISELNKILELEKKAAYANQGGKTTPIGMARGTAARLIIEERKSSFIKAPLEDIHPDDIAEMSDDNYKELVSTGYTMFQDQHGETIELTTKFGDNKIRKEENKNVSSKPKEANKEVVSQTFINFATEEDFDEDDFSDVELGNSSVTTEDLDNLDDGEVTTNCKKS